MAIMVVTFGGFVWMAAKVYRTGILMYGKKTSWKEMWKWLRYSRIRGAGRRAQGTGDELENT